MNTEEPLPLPGATRASDQKFCHACATPLHISATMCPRCGAQQPSMQSTMPTPAMAPVMQPPVPVYAPPPAQMPQRITADQRFCHGCGSIIHASAPTCPHCGAQQPGAMAAYGGGYGAYGAMPVHGVIKSRVTARHSGVFSGRVGRAQILLRENRPGVFVPDFFLDMDPGPCRAGRRRRFSDERQHGRRIYPEVLHLIFFISQQEKYRGNDFLSWVWSADT